MEKAPQTRQIGISHWHLNETETLQITNGRDPIQGFI
jgi:hypothetical protein